MTSTVCVLLSLTKESRPILFFADGVYKSGFATTQEAYETAVLKVFESLDRVEKMLEGKEYLIGDRLTEADIRLFVTIVSSLDAPTLSSLLIIYPDPLRPCVRRAFQV